MRKVAQGNRETPPQGQGHLANAAVVENKPLVRRHPGVHTAPGVGLSTHLPGEEMNIFHEWLSLHIMTPVKVKTLL